MPTSVRGFCFSKRNRLLKREEFVRVKEKGRRFSSPTLLFNYFFNNRHSYPKLGIVTPRALGPAHKRNRYKRLIREVFRKARSSIPPGLEISILPKKGINLPDYQAIEADFLLFLESCQAPRKAFVTK